LQFDCTNTLNDQVLEKVSVQMETNDDFEVIRTIPAASLPYDKPGTTYTVVRLPEDPTQGIIIRRYLINGTYTIHFSYWNIYMHPQVCCQRL
jgi:hypothetical protein